MKSLSKIIKSHNLILVEPITINHLRAEDAIWEMTEIELEIEGTKGIQTMGSFSPDISGEKEDKIDLDQVRNEAENILRETEVMITDILERARTEATSIIAEARHEAQEIKNQALEEAKNLGQNAQETGYQDGWQKALAENEEERQRAVKESQRLIEEASQERIKIIQSSEEVMVRLALSIAKKIVGKEIEQNPDIIISLVKEALELIGDADSVKILVHPQDFEMLMNERIRLVDPGTTSLNLQADALITSGGCLLESDVGVIDATMETRVANLKNALLEVAGHG